MNYNPANLLSSLLEATPLPTAQAPRDTRGLYGLVDHHGDLRYIGSTSSSNQTFYSRIHQRHRTGSEGMSHYFSHMYNTGRMWRDRTSMEHKADGDVAKSLRNEFIKDHCRAVWVPLPASTEIAEIELSVIALAPEHAVAWNRRRTDIYEEPANLVDATLRRLDWGKDKLDALDRQRQRCDVFGETAGQYNAVRHSAAVAPFPKGPFKFFALDVETANSDRSSICQIGIAGVRMDDSIETWGTYIEPQVSRWSFSSLHGINASTVRGMPKFSEILPLLRGALQGASVYQHSGFDQSAIAAACLECNLEAPRWNWCDSAALARATWPNLRGTGGYGLANLKKELGLVFKHHDAVEDARAAAEIVLRAECALLA